ncbi:hypothetical protein BH10ACI2_BH10ACI2_13480 [soil metagenome]
MGSDVPDAMGPVTTGNSQLLAIGVESGRSPAPKPRAFGRPFADDADEQCPWAALFGMLTDKFGFTWIIKFDQDRQP